MRLLVHIAGEADLLLDSRGSSSPVRAERISARRAELGAALTGPDGAGAVRRMLTGDAWQGEPFSTPAPSPAFGALDALDATPDLEVVVLGTSQPSPHPLDTLPIAQTLADVLTGIATDDDSYLVRKATAVPVSGLTEEVVVDALTSHLRQAPPYQRALVTWGSGATALAMGVLTALSRAGLPWQLILTSGPDAYQVVDPLGGIDIDPVAGVFVRWRMFAALEELVRTGPPAVQLTGAQRDLVCRAAQRHRAGFEARDCASLRAVLADAVVRRDGTASLAVRRYVTSRYEELLAVDRINHPWVEDLLLKYEKPKGGPPLGAKLSEIRHAHHNDPMVCASIDLPSYKWLYGPEVNSLQNIGKGSHNLRPPATCDSKVIGDYLSRYDTDESGWRDAGLPEPPITPADAVLAVWPAGLQSRPGVGTVGQQLSSGLPAAVLDHLGVDKTRIRAVILGVDDGQGSHDHATADAKLIGDVTYQPTGEPRGEAWVEPIALPDIDPVTIERAIEKRLTRETGALLLIPTGGKPVVLALLRAMRRIGARHGLPLFVRQTADPAAPGVYPVYLWPALTGGDLPLLNAATGALRALELDVAWRLLAASAIDPEVTDKARRLAATFASRGPLRDTDPDPASASRRGDWKTGLIAQRLELVDAALAHTTVSADRIRLLVLAADALEASIAATRTSGRMGAEYREFREGLEKDARCHGEPKAVSARILLLLNAARDRAPITHGTGTDPDAVVADAADRLAAKWGWASIDVAMLPSDVSTLLRQAVVVAAERGLGQPDHADSLLRLHKEIIEDIDGAIDQRGPRSEAQYANASPDRRCLADAGQPVSPDDAG